MENVPSIIWPQLGNSLGVESHHTLQPHNIIFNVDMIDQTQL